MTESRNHAKGGTHRARGRVVPIVWLASAIAALVMTLGVNGTLSAWTTAIINNNTNTVATATAVILQEVGPDGTATHASQTCQSSAGTGNSFVCTNINKYGGTTTPLTPGASQSTTVVFTNLGASAASTFVLTPGVCASTPSTGTPTPANLCTTDLTMALSCSPGTTYAAGSAWTDLVYPAGLISGLPTTLTHATGLAAGASATCVFTVSLPTTASVLDQGVTLTQPLTWTLNK